MFNGERIREVEERLAEAHVQIDELTAQLDGAHLINDELTVRVEEIDRLGVALPLAKDIVSSVDELVCGDTPPDEAYKIATNRVRDAYKNKRINELADTLAVELAEEQKTEIEAEVDVAESELRSSILAELHPKRPQILEELIAKRTAELEALELESLLEKLGDEVSTVALNSLRAIAQERATVKIDQESRNAWLDRCRSKMRQRFYLDIGDVPKDEVLTIGLTDQKTSGVEKSFFQDVEMKRTISLRVVDASKGVLSVIDDSWNDDDGVLHREASLKPDEIVVVQASSDAEKVAILNKASVPQIFFYDKTAGASKHPVIMGGLELHHLQIGPDWLLGAART